MANSNHTELSRQLAELSNKLTRSQNDMKNASEERLSNIFHGMTRAAINTTRHCLLRTRVERILQSLTFDNISDRESGIPISYQDTFRWSLSETSTTLPSWLRSGTGIYWIEGKAGCGKSTLMKFLQQDQQATALLKEWANGLRLRIVRHYFWAPGTTMQKSLLGLFRTLLFQILVNDPELLEQICPLRMENHGHMQPWTLDELAECFETLSKIQTLPSKLCFFVDGLDEFEGDPEGLIAIIQAISKSNSIKLCVASRPWPPFRKAFGYNSLRISVHEFTRDDINLYTQGNLGQSQEYQKLQATFPEQAKSLSKEISDAADGVFLWVYLVIRDLLRGLTQHDDLGTLQRRLRAMPRDLNDYFQRMLDSIEDVYRSEVRSLLGILAYMRLPLDTYITWGHRNSREMTLISSNNLLEFPPHGSRHFSMERKVEGWKGNFDTSGRVSEYSPRTERQRIIARCKDLVHVSEEDTPSRDLAHQPVFKVSFLHRTVAEFVGSALTNDADRSRPLLPIVALAGTYLMLRLHQYNHEIRFADFQAKQILYLALQAKQHSPAAYLRIVHILCALTQYFDHGLRPTRYLLGTVMASNVFVEGECTCRDALTWKEERFWLLHCRACLAPCHQDAVDDLSELLVKCFGTPLIPSLVDGTVTVEELPEANLRVVEALVSKVKSTNVAAFSDAWRKGLWELENQPSHGGKPPANIYDVCCIFIRHGAPRVFVDDDNDDHDHDEIDALQILQKIPPMKDLDPTGELLKQEFLLAKKLSKQLQQQTKGQGQKSWFQRLVVWR